MTTKTTTRTTLNSKRAQLPTTSTQRDPTPGPSNPRQNPPTNQNTNPPRPSLPPLTPSSEPRPDGHGGDGGGDGGGDDNDDDSNDPDPGDQGGQPPAPPSPPPAPTPVPAADEDHRRLIELLEAVRSKPKQKAKLREPDPFDGSDSRKLRSFLALCQLNFRSQSSAFSDDASKVNYALSYLKGTALDWFEPALTNPDYEDTWLENWDEFVAHLRYNFGPADPVGDAEEGLDALRMRDGQKIAKYNVEFNKFAAIVEWGDSALKHAYYKGLPDRIKDSLVHLKKPDTLAALRSSAQTVDVRYWERRSEKTRDQPSSSKPDKASTSDHKSSDKDKGKDKKSNDSKSNKNSGSNSGNQKKTSDLADKLGKDGKLTQQERQRRFDNNLCMFCGGEGHIASDCTKSTSRSSKAKARSAKADESKK